MVSLLGIMAQMILQCFKMHVDKRRKTHDRILSSAALLQAPVSHVAASQIANGEITGRQCSRDLISDSI
jgi:hypothetical protein